MPARRRGKISARRTPTQLPADDKAVDAHQEEHKPPMLMPYLFSPADPAIFDQNAFTLVHTTLSALPIPYRLDDLAGLIPPQELVKLYRKAR